MLLMAFKSVVVVVTFNKLKYRCKHLNIMSSCVNVPKNFPEIMLFCYQLFYNCLFIFTFVKFSYIMLMILNSLGRQFMYFLFQDTKGASY